MKCAEIFWKLGAPLMEYRCATCPKCFYSHLDCFEHIQLCLQIQMLESSPVDSKEEMVEQLEHDLSNTTETLDYDSIKEGTNYCICY